jgi:hypothetical protein
MPDTDGRKLIQQIKAIHPETRCILFSGKITTYDTDTPADVCPVTEGLNKELGVRMEDVFISLLEVKKGGLDAQAASAA